MIRGYNERSWAIDLIGYLKSIASTQDRPVKEIGGERNVSEFGSSLFPDVLLFGDSNSAVILQGWELKFPDTPIDDIALLQNAEKKARVLGLNSFVVWNVTEARLFVFDDELGLFTIRKSWTDLLDIRDRRDVHASRARWQATAKSILDTVNDYLANGDIDGREFIEAYESERGVTGFIDSNLQSVASNLQVAASTDADFRRRKDVWWATVEKSYEGISWDIALAGSVLNNWVFKLLFANILRSKFSAANAVDLVASEPSPEDALAIFDGLSDSINFWPIFANSVGLSQLPSKAWEDVRQFGNLLADLKLGSVDQRQTSRLFEATYAYSRRRLRGQFATPELLASMCAHLSLDDIRTARVLDPCAGSGTIPRAVASLKRIHSTRDDVIAHAVYAGDIDPIAVQVSTFALSAPQTINLPVKVFSNDALTLSPDTTVDFRDPNTGQPFQEDLGLFDAVISNLPFVSQAGRKPFSQQFHAINAELQESLLRPLPGRSDLAAFIAVKISALVREGGTLCLILTNAWLGTAWGDALREYLTKDFHLEMVITSGAGRWFTNASIIANIVVWRRRAVSTLADEETTKFVTLTTPLAELEDIHSMGSVVSHIRSGLEIDTTHRINQVSKNKLEEFGRIGLAGSAQFVNCDWALELPLAPLKRFADITRGERRGLNALFYPEGDHNIESDYLTPLVKSPKELRGLVSRPENHAFVCLETIEHLRSRGHSGALSWIARFDSPENRSKLAKTGLAWYQMRAERLSELVIPMAFYERFLVSRLSPRAFVDQRLVTVALKDEFAGRVDIFHALLNTTLSFFFIEGIGFGRGDGVLDLNKDRLEDVLHLLDPATLSPDAVARIVKAFAPLLERDVLNINEELDQQDRVDFDTVVHEEFGLSVKPDEIYESFQTLLSIRIDGAQRIVGE